jgi:hypothetical protein
MVLHNTLSSIKFYATFSFHLFFIGQVIPSFVNELCLFELIISTFPYSWWLGEDSSFIIANSKQNVALAKWASTMVKGSIFANIFLICPF